VGEGRLNRGALLTLGFDARMHFRSQAQVDAAQQDIEVLKECGVPFELLDRAAVSRAEPALRYARSPLTGGLRLPNDETGDSHIFTEQLAALLPKLGVEMRFGESVEGFEVSGRRIISVRLVNGARLHADRYVLAFGSFSRNLMLPLGLDIPVYPVKGYSLTLPLANDALAPVSTVLDETYKIAITRFDKRIRVGGMAELAGFDHRSRPARRTTLEMVVSDLFPGGDLQQGAFWTGLRPMTPDGTPIVGATELSQLFLNTGHGTLGWTMACGSARMLADLMTDHRPEISTSGLDMSRYGRASPKSRWWNSAKTATS